MDPNNRSRGDELSTFPVKFSYKGKSTTVSDAITLQTSPSELLDLARREFQVGEEVHLKLLHKGKIIAQEFLEGSDEADSNNGDGNYNQSAFASGVTIPKNGPIRIIVMGTEAQGVRKLNSRRSDPTIRGFDDNKNFLSKSNVLSTYWGPNHGNQNPNYKFCRFQECTDASFGTRPGASTPHAFEARRLLERLAADPGIISILKSRELVVGTLGEMDPIDDRLMHKKQQEGACLLGYNTNHGMRIDVKLRTDDLSAFRPYPELAATLIHELSHNWVGEHDVLFWTNYGQMRVEYLWKHACLMLGGEFVNGKRTASLAGVMEMIVPNGGGGSGRFGSLNDSQTMEFICQSVFNEMAKEMAQHRIPVQMVSSAIIEFSKELLVETDTSASDLRSGGQRLGPAPSAGGNEAGSGSARDRALAAAEKRAREAKRNMDR